MTDSLKIWGTDYTGVKGFKAKDSSNNQYAYLRPQGTKSISQNGTGIDVTEYAAVDVSVSGGGETPTIDSLTVTPTTSQQVFNSSSVDGYKPVTVEAMPSGTEGTPSATKGTVSNHSVSVTPSVTNTAGYISGGEHTGTTVSVSASELVSGSETKTSNGTYDVTNLASLEVNVPTGTARTSSDVTVSGDTVSVPAGLYSSAVSKSVVSGTAGTPTATKGTVSNHSINVTPSVTNTTGYITGSTKTGEAVTVTAAELESGTKSITENGTNIDVSGYSAVDVNVPSSGSSKAIYTYKGLASRTANSYGATSASVTVTKAGTYTISYVAVRGSSSGTMGTNLHIGSSSGANNTTWNKGTYGQSVTLTGQTIPANTAVTIYATSGNNSRTIYVGQLIVEEE